MKSFWECWVGSWGQGPSSDCPGQDGEEDTSSSTKPEEAPVLEQGGVGSATDLLCSVVWGALSVFASVSPVREDSLKVPLDGPTNGQDRSHMACGSVAKGRPNQERQGAGPALRGAEVGCDWTLGLEEGVWGAHRDKRR